MTLKLIIFDCDGTLVDSQHMIVAAMANAFEAHALAPPSRSAILGIVGLSLPEAIFHLVPNEADETILSLSEGYKTAFGELRLDPANQEPLYEGAKDAVHTLAGQERVVLGIATGKSRRGVDRVMTAYGLLDQFSTIQTADDAPSKPHPGMIEQAMDAVGATPDNTVMIGDTSFDMEMARRAGARALGVSWGYHPDSDLIEAGADHVARDFGDLMECLQRGNV